MNRILNAEEWKIDTQFPQHLRHAEISIYFKTPELTNLAGLDIETRRHFVIHDRKEKLIDLLSCGYIDKYEIIGSENNPIGLRCKILFDRLQFLKKHRSIGSGGIIIHRLEGAKKMKKKIGYSYFCMKLMAVLENDSPVKNNDELYEERFVIIRAKSFEDAYKRMKKHEKITCEPYLNSNFEIVRWKIIDYEDCFLTDIHNFSDLNDSSGKVVYSILERKHSLEVS